MSGLREEDGTGWLVNNHQTLVFLIKYNMSW